ncbi:MAG: hypothetical protein FWH48_07290, partial [Oscillospiraceae bacterium]|nr:hypothetical protein [Oscillospiraceae bacterium]
EVCVCTAKDRILTNNKFDIALIEPDFWSPENIGPDTLVMLLVEDGDGTSPPEIKKICKYQRISAIVEDMLGEYSAKGKMPQRANSHMAHIVAVWSPAGGAGKTTVALAYAANRAAADKRATYLNLENFASTPAYFQGGGTSISKVFEKLENSGGIFISAMRQTDASSQISYFCAPENYDDMNILSGVDLETLILACAADTDELVVDLSSQCDERTAKIFELADKILLVCEPSSAAQAKLGQFAGQHDVFGKIQHKLVLVDNKGANTKKLGIENTIGLPYVPSADPVAIFMALSKQSFD